MKEGKIIRISRIEQELTRLKFIVSNLLGNYSCFEINNLLEKTEGKIIDFEKRIMLLEEKQINMDQNKENGEEKKEETNQRRSDKNKS